MIYQQELTDTLRAHPKASTCEMERGNIELNILWRDVVKTGK